MAGISIIDRKLGAEVRRLTLKKIKAILESGKDLEFQKAVILKLASTVLPRINEHSGEGGEAMKVIVEVASEISNKHALTHDTTGDSEGQS